MSLEQEVELIRQFPIFSKIQPAMQKLLVFSAERLSYVPGQVMFNAGDMGDAAYIVINGEVEISVPTPGGPTPQRIYSTWYKLCIGVLRKFARRGKRKAGREIPTRLPARAVTSRA